MPGPRNPWLDIPAGDYEAHMSQAGVGQLQALSAIFAQCYIAFLPGRVLVPGCAMGTGFEHIDPRVTRRITAVDINPAYLAELSKRHGARLPGMEALCLKLTRDELPAGEFDLIFAALIFEYVEPGRLLSALARRLARPGLLVAVLQLPCEQGSVSPTPYTSLKALEPVMRLVDPAEFIAQAQQTGLVCTRQYEHALPGTKRFAVVWLERG